MKRPTQENVEHMQQQRGKQDQEVDLKQQENHRLKASAGLAAAGLELTPLWACALGQHVMPFGQTGLKVCYMPSLETQQKRWGALLWSVVLMLALPAHDVSDLNMAIR